MLLLVIVAQPVKKVQMSISRSTVAHPYDGTQLSNKKEPANTCNSHTKKNLKNILLTVIRLAQKSVCYKIPFDEVLEEKISDKNWAVVAFREPGPGID